MKNNFRQTAIFYLPLLMLLGSTLNLDAQISNFKLSDYKPPKYIFQSLDFGINLSGSTLNDRNKLADTLLSGNGSSSLSFNVSPGYNRSSNSEKYQGTMIAILSLVPGFNSSTNKMSEYKSRQRQLHAGLDVKSENRFYFNSGTFLEINPQFSIGRVDFNQRAASNSSKSQNKQSSGYISLSLPLSFGIGRIDNASDAMLAIYMLDDLDRLGLSKRSFTNEDVIQLAGRITHLKTRRFFDYRKQLIYEIESIDSLMQQNTMVQIANAAYFTSLNDNWRYSQNISRKSGYRLYAGILSSFFYQVNTNYISRQEPDQNETKDQNIFSHSTIGLMAGYMLEKPHSLKWQSTVDLRLQYTYYHSINKVKSILPDPTDFSTRYELTQPGPGAQVSYYLGYYPNSRTYFTAGILGYFDWEINGTEDMITVNDHTGVNDIAFRGGPRVAAYFYLSERVRLQININCDYLYDKSNSWSNSYTVNSDQYLKNHSFNGSVNSALTYSLF